jgi:hypothetical protein
VEDRTQLKTRNLRQDCFEDFNELESEKKPSRRSEDSSEMATQRDIYNLLVGILKTLHLAILSDMNRTTDSLEKSSNSLSVLGESADRRVGM